MATLKTKFSVGLFLIIGISFVIVGIVWLGMSNYFEKGRYFVAYFDESVQGLDKDSPVKYRGVYIGRVHHVGVAPDERLIEVVMKIESELEPQALTQDVVAQLKSVGITGLMFVELERDSNRSQFIYPPSQFEPPYPVVPTRPSEISKLFKGIDDVINIFRALDTKEISDQLVQALSTINGAIEKAQLDVMVSDVRKTLDKVQQMVRSEETQQLLASMRQTSDSFNKMALNADGGITDLRQAVSRLETVVGSSSNDIQQVTADLKASAQQIKRAMDTAANLMETTDRKVGTMQSQILVTLTSIERASNTLNLFLDRVAAQPSQIVFSGEPPEKPAAP